MDLEDIQSNLNALRKLYGLLQNDGDGLQNASSLTLDDKTRLLLKKLLDGATERIFEAYSKIIAAQWSTQLGPPKDTLKLESLVSADDVSSTSPSAAQNSQNDPSFHKIASKKNEQEPSELPTQAGVTEQLKLRIAASEPEKREKRCQVCHRRSVKQLNSAKDIRPSEEKTQNSKKDVSFQHHQHNCCSHNLRVSGLVKGFELDKMGVESASNIENQRQKRNCEIQYKLTRIGSSHLSSIPTTEQEPVGTNQTPKEVTDAIKQIELCISSLQLAAESVVPPEKKNAAQHAVRKTMANPIPGTDSVTPIMQTKERLVTRSELRQAGEFVLGSNDSLSEAAEFVLGTNDSLRQQVSRSVWEAKGSSLVHQMPSQTVSQIKAIKLPNKTNSQTSKPVPPSNYLVSRLVNQKVGRSKAIALVDDTVSELGKPIEGHKLTSQKASQFPGQNVNTIVEKVKSLSRVTSQNDHTPSQTHKFVQGFRVPPARNEIANGAPLLPDKIPSQINKENRDQNRIPQLSHPSTPYQSVGSTDFMGLNGKFEAVDAGHMLRRTQNRGETQRKCVLPHQTIMRPSLLDQKPGQIMVPHPLSEDRMDQERSVAQKLNRMGQRRKIFPHEQEWEVSSASASASYSSTRTSQLASTSSDESKKSSLPGKSRTRYYMTPISSSESKVYQLPGRSRGNQVDSTSSSEIDGYSLPSKARYHRAGLTDGSESDSYPPSDWTTESHRMEFSETSQTMSSTSRRIGPSKNYRSDNRANPERRNGRLRKLKDKLAIIFHHHHHHHHHHHNHDQTKVGGGASLWKNAGKAFHRAGKDEALGKQMVEKLGKSLVRNASAKNQRGHFHMLVEGLLRHVRHSKKLKPSTGGVRPVAKGQHGSKKVAKKSHWWQMLQHRRGVKLPNRPRVKLGYGSKKPQLRALPKKI